MPSNLFNYLKSSPEPQRNFVTRRVLGAECGKCGLVHWYQEPVRVVEMGIPIYQSVEVHCPCGRVYTYDVG